jgi:hypothetical protein
MGEGLRRAGAICFVVGSLLFAYTTVRHVWESRLLVPFFDEWDFLDWYRHVLADGLSLHALWLPHNGHHLPLPRLIYFLRDWLTNGSPAALVLANLLIQAAVIAVLARLALKEPAFAGTMMRWVVMSATIVTLSWTVQIENFHWSIQIIYVLAAAQAVASLYFLAQMPVRGTSRLLIALLFAISDTLTLGAGLGVWPALLVGTIALRAGGRALVPIIVLTGAAAAVYLATPGEAPQGIADALGRPFDLLHYMARYLGPPFADDRLRLALGGLLIACAVGVILVTLWRGTRSGFIVLHLGLVTFGLSVALLTALARLSVGIGEAGSSRYAAFSTLFWVGLISLAAHAAVTRRWQPLRWGLYAMLSALFVFLIAASQNVAAEQFRARADASIAAVLSLVAGAPDAPAIHRDLHPRPEVPAGLLDFVQQQAYGLFGSPWMRSMNRPAAEALPPENGACGASMSAEALPGGARLTGRFADGVDAPRRLVVVAQDGRVHGLGIRGYRGHAFTAYMSGPPEGAVLFGYTGRQLCRAGQL